MILVSSCLLGMTCRYDGKAKEYPQVLAYLKGKPFIIVCPEQMGGLETPRNPAEIHSLNPLKIVNDQGCDVTQNFENGVSDVMKLIEHYDIELAILKSLSPSCGSEQVYDGTFSRRLVVGEGLLAKALRVKNIKVINELSLG